MSRIRDFFANWWELVCTGVFLVVAVVALVIFMFAITFSSQIGPMDRRFGLTDSAVTSCVITDGDTGVQYLVLQRMSNIAITPLLSADGLPLMVDDLNHGDMETALESARANLGVG